MLHERTVCKSYHFRGDRGGRQDLTLDLVLESDVVVDVDVNITTTSTLAGMQDDAKHGFL